MKRLLVVMPSLAIAASLASAAPELKKGGVFKVGTTGSSVSIDPQVSYVSTGWWLEYATAAKLFNYPDRSGQAGSILRPEVASRYAVSRDGKTYTFWIRRGFRFSDGARVTAGSFAYAFRRAKNTELGSPAAAFVAGVTSVRAGGDKLTLRLAKPDPSLLSTLALPFFQATSTKLPLTKKVTTGYPSAGPYYFSRNEINTLTSIRQNRFWRHGPGRERPRHLSGVDVEWGLDEQTAFDRVRSSELNRLDLGPVPAAEVEGLVDRFGVNKTRFWSKPSSCIAYIPFNTERGILAGNPQLRKAINWALDREDYAALGGPAAREPWTHILSPLTPGSVTAKARQPYGRRANLEKARRLASGHFRDGKIVVGFRLSGTTGTAQAELVRRDLIRLGFKPENITMKGFAGGQIYDAIGVRGAAIDLAAPLGWCTDVHDAYQELKPYASLDGRYARKLERANRLSGLARLRAFGNLDVEMMRNLAPLAPMATYNNRYLFSNRVNPRSLVYVGAYADWSIPALALK